MKVRKLLFAFALLATLCCSTIGAYAQRYEKGPIAKPFFVDLDAHAIPIFGGLFASGTYNHFVNNGLHVGGGLFYGSLYDYTIVDDYAIRHFKDQWGGVASLGYLFKKENRLNYDLSLSVMYGKLFYANASIALHYNVCRYFGLKAHLSFTNLVPTIGVGVRF